MSTRQHVDDLAGLDDRDRMLASDMDDNCPIYPPGERVESVVAEEIKKQVGKSAA